jgi:hypothetical protein
MNTRKEMNSEQQGNDRLAEAEAAGASDVRPLRKVTFAENVIVTMKILVGFALLGTALWGIELWISAN